MRNEKTQYAQEVAMLKQYGDIEISLGGIVLEGDLVIPEAAQGIVVFAHGSGSSRFSPRNRYVASVLQQAGLGTLLLDLLTPEEEGIDSATRHLRFDIDMLKDRLVGAAHWLRQQPECRDFKIGMFGASTGAAAALLAAARHPQLVDAVVSRGGRPDLAGEDVLQAVQAPTLLLVGAEDHPVLCLNEEAFALIPAPKELVFIPGATHLFEEPGTLEAVARHAAEWFARYLGRVPSPR